MTFWLASMFSDRVQPDHTNDGIFPYNPIVN